MSDSSSNSSPRPLFSSLLTNMPGIVHGVTSRIHGMGLADGNVGDTDPRDPADAWQMRLAWGRVIGYDAERLVRTGQVHGNDVFVVLEEHAGMGRRRDTPIPAIADAAITQAINIPLMTLAADCLPILMYDPKQHAIAAVHAGWRSTVIDIAGETIRAMQQAFGSDPADIRAFLGPAIGACCNEVGPEVTGQWRELADARGISADVAIVAGPRKEHFDVPGANVLLLQHAGIQPNHIENAAICTKCNGDQWFSHRGQGPATGRQAGVIMLTGNPV